MQRYNLYLRYKSNFILFRLNIPTSWITNIPLPLFPGCYVEEQHTPARHPARDAGSSSWHKRNNNGDSLPPRYFWIPRQSHDQGCHPALNAGSSSWHKRNSNSDSPPRIFLDTTSECGMTKGVTPHAMRGPVHGIRGITTGTLSPRYFWIPRRGAV